MWVDCVKLLRLKNVCRYPSMLFKEVEGLLLCEYRVYGVRNDTYFD